MSLCRARLALLFSSIREYKRVQYCAERESDHTGKFDSSSYVPHDKLVLNLVTDAVKKFQ